MLRSYAISRAAVGFGQTLDNQTAELYNFYMSNMTDGKKALAAGEFEVAERKLIKALENRPADGELWWALMLCKFGWKNDAQMESSLVDAFTDAARSGAAVPQTPFDSSYCKNALEYSINTKRRDLVTRINGRLNDIWLAERGKPLKLAVYKQKKHRQADKYKISICAICLAELLCVIAAVFGIYKFMTWLEVIGLIAFAVCVVSFFVLCRLAEKRGSSTTAVYITGTIVLLAGGVAFATVGYATGDKAAFICAGVVICVAALAAVSRLMRPRAKKNNKSKNSSAVKTSKSTVETTRPCLKTDVVGGKSEYEDKYD